MKGIKERNPYLKRTFSQQPHKYSYDLDTGKYFLIDERGSQIPINKNGSLPSHFKKNFTGFVNHKERYQESKNDKTLLHFTPDLEFKKQNSYYTPVTRKFRGYAQYPYKIKGMMEPVHLNDPNQPHSFKRPKKSIQQKKKTQGTRKSQNLILQNTANTFITNKVDDHYFQKSFTSMTETKPLPKYQKRTCYNYKCKYMRNFSFDVKEKTQLSTRMTNNTMTSWAQKTMGKTFYDQKLKRQKQEEQMHSSNF